MTLKEEITELLETYQRRLESLNELLKKDNIISEHRRLKGKVEVVKLIIFELKGLLKT